MMEERTEVTTKDEILYQLWKEEEIMNGYFHLTQRSLHGENKDTVGIKSFHVEYAEKMGVPIMIHHCPKLDENGKKIYKANYKDQESVMIIQPKDFYNLRFNSKSSEEDGEVKLFTRRFKSKVDWINENYDKYEVWHYKWLPDYVTKEGIKDKSSNIDDCLLK